MFCLSHNQMDITVKNYFSYLFYIMKIGLNNDIGPMVRPVYVIFLHTFLEIYLAIFRTVYYVFPLCLKGRSTIFIFHGSDIIRPYNG